MDEIVCKHEVLVDLQKFMAGEMTMTMNGKGKTDRLMERNIQPKKLVLLDTTFPFFLTNFSGNPHIFFFEERNDGSLDGESFNLVIARAKQDKMQDMLFIGGDFNENHGFSAWNRIA